MVPELRVPVSRLDARLLTDDGVSHQVTVFLPPGEDVGHLLAAREPFLPVSEEGRIRLVARSTIAAIAARRQGSEAPPALDDELLTSVRTLIVRLRGGAVLQGTLRYGAVPGQSRTADLLNEPTPTFTLEVDGAQYRIAKAHVASVDEA
jgi:hypothetical protein